MVVGSLIQVKRRNPVRKQPVSGLLESYGVKAAQALAGYMENLDRAAARRSPRGYSVAHSPVVVVVEAKNIPALKKSQRSTLRPHCLVYYDRL